MSKAIFAERTGGRMDIMFNNVGIAIKGDPADQLIAATSVVQQVPLLTRDRQLRRSKLVPLAN